MSKDKSKKKSKVDKPKDGLALSEDRYLLTKVMSAKCLKEVVDISDVDFDVIITRQDIMNAGDSGLAGDSSTPPQGIAKKHFIQRLYEYQGGKPQEGDIVCWYNDIRVLSGSAGFMLLRDGYVVTTLAIWRS